MSEPKFKVGQTVTHRDGHTEYEARAVVTRVGTKNVYIRRWGQELAFRIEDGTEVRGPNAVGPGGRILTDEDIADVRRRRAVVESLRSHGIAPILWKDFPQSTGVLERLLAVLNEDGGINA